MPRQADAGRRGRLDGLSIWFKDDPNHSCSALQPEANRSYSPRMGNGVSANAFERIGPQVPRLLPFLPRKLQIAGLHLATLPRAAHVALATNKASKACLEASLDFFHYLNNSSTFRLGL